MSDHENHIDSDSLLLIVVGAHPRAEMTDRPIAYRLRERMASWLLDKFPEGDPPLTPMVLTDLWYLNDAALRRSPSVSIGSPGVNAFSAYLGDKLPSAFVVDDRLMVQMDLDFSELVACCWGVDTETTGHAVDAFTDRYLEDFLEAATKARAA
ncbi:MAG TPA: hypothetical protein VHC70_11055 [Phycisphaerales bacterium]|nr:hypothetical protein [Phycisphaerales bacterium]